jgi:hypothetical protein
MTIAVAVTLLCDNRRAPGCHWSFPLGADPAPAALAARVDQAAEVGWMTLQFGGTAAHLCPICNGARLAGADVSPPPAEAEAFPRTIGEAAEQDRRRRAHQDDG